MLLPVLLSGG